MPNGEAELDEDSTGNCDSFDLPGV